jgi:DNA (cytosine-5)-methyltransferase 1
MSIPVIDLFAGPGGLGEGFSALRRSGESVFKIKLSIEKDKWAHQTLELRAFFREFPFRQVPNDYYDYISRAITRKELFARHPDEARRAQNETWFAELGSKSVPADQVYNRINAAIGNCRLWVLIGGPPCQAYSLAGRSRVIGDGKGLKRYEADPKHRLYLHYLHILASHRPPVFIMENVKGLLSAKVKKEHIFAQILADLKHPRVAKPATKALGLLEALEYRLFPLAAETGDLLEEFKPEDFVVRAEDYGIPQARHRIIILGIRSDLAVTPDSLKRSSEVPIEKVIGDLPKLRSVLSKEQDSPEIWQNAVRELVNVRNIGKDETTTELCEGLCSAARRISASLNRGGLYVPESTMPACLADWYSDAKLKGICNHETRGHIRADLHRYFFAAVFARTVGRSPLLEDFPKALLPKHKNVAAALKDIKFNDRFRVQLAHRPATTVVSHIAKDGHYYIHYDPTQCRSLTVREAARLQTFPDNYFFEGPRTQQYLQVGNAVPPLLARQIAEIVADLLFRSEPTAHWHFAGDSPYPR